MVQVLHHGSAAKMKNPTFLDNRVLLAELFYF
jgi:hypothetical protein